jgi:lipid A 3-O-deacylase
VLPRNSFGAEQYFLTIVRHGIVCSHRAVTTRDAAIGSIALLLVLTEPARSGTDLLSPARVFAQAGLGDQQTQAYVVGLAWDFPWRLHLSLGTLYVYGEVDVGRWHAGMRDADATAWPTQLSAVPTFRLYPAHRRFFLEAGVGPSYIIPLFRSGEKHFSSQFNFDDHVALGVNLARSELAVRLEHFSNAGISHPNPGENFVQLRYAYHL